MKNSKKAIHPVVSVALLLVVAVVGVVAFQTWFVNFQTDVLATVEQDTNNQIPSDIYIEDLTRTKIFLKSHSGSSIISNVEIIATNNTVICTISNTFNVPTGLSTIDVTTCNLIYNLPYTILITANNQLVENSQIVR